MFCFPAPDYLLGFRGYCLQNFSLFRTVGRVTPSFLPHLPALAYRGAGER
jgi:hypothetical protein